MNNPKASRNAVETGCLWGQQMAAPVIPTVAQTVMKTIRLNSGAVLPQLGLGTWKIPTERTAHIVKEAIRVGFTHLGGETWRRS